MATNQTPIMKDFMVFSGTSKNGTKMHIITQESKFVWYALKPGASQYENGQANTLEAAKSELKAFVTGEFH